MSWTDKVAVRLSLVLIFTVLFFVYVFWRDQRWSTIHKLDQDSITGTMYESSQEKSWLMSKSKFEWSTTKKIEWDSNNSESNILENLWALTGWKTSDKQLISMAVLWFESKQHFVDIFWIHWVYLWKSPRISSQSMQVMTWSQIGKIGLWGKKIIWINERIWYPQTTVMIVTVDDSNRLLQMRQEIYYQQKKYIKRYLQSLGWK